MLVYQDIVPRLQNRYHLPLHLPLHLMYIHDAAFPRQCLRRSFTLLYSSISSASEVSRDGIISKSEASYHWFFTPTH